MTEYLGMTLLALVAVFVIDNLTGTKLYKTKYFWKFQILIVLLTVWIDGYLASLPTEIFNPSIMGGVFIGKAPIENVVFGLDMMYLNVILYEIFSRKIIKKLESQKESFKA